MAKHDGPEPVRSLFEAHPRSFESNRYVYPVLSRRAGGISIGVNLNPDKGCNFKCVYCQVDRSEPGERRPIDIERLTEELDHMLDLVTSGRIYRETKFRDTPEPLRRLNDVALSGDGEPTMCPKFDEVVSACVAARGRRPERVKLVLLTNASMFHHDRVRRGLAVLTAAGGEIWAKLDAGTEAYFHEVAHSAVPWRRILDNLAEAARRQPIVIQSLFMRIHGEPPPPAERDAYCDLLDEILARGGRIKLVQIHTIARPPAQSRVAALSDAELDTLARHVRDRTGLTVAAFGRVAPGRVP